MTPNIANVPDVTGLLDRLFKKCWHGLNPDGWNEDQELKYPGVYLLAYSNEKLEGQTVKNDEVYYVGMSNSEGGVRARLKQFMSGVETGHGHSAGDHFYRANKKPFSELGGDEKFYFVALCLKCSTSQKSGATADDFRTMGDVACLEYYAIAHVLACSTAKKVPQLNRSAGGVGAAN